MSALHLPKTPWAGTRNDRKGGTFAHAPRRQPPAQSAASSRSPIAIKSRASPQSVLGASSLTCRYGCSTGHQEGEIRRREAATEISSLAVIGLPPLPSHATVTGGLIPTAQWWGVEIKNVPSASALAT